MGGLLKLDRSIIGEEFDVWVAEPVRREDLIEFALAIGETNPRYFGDDPVASPTFIVRFRGKRFFHPKLPRDMVASGVDAGKDITFGAPIRSGDVITSRMALHDIYEKTGRTGTMVFLVGRQTLMNQRGEMVAVIDNRFMLRPRASG